MNETTTRTEPLILNVLTTQARTELKLDHEMDTPRGVSVFIQQARIRYVIGALKKEISSFWGFQFYQHFKQYYYRKPMNSSSTYPDSDEIRQI